MRYAQLASRVFGVPLMIERNKLEVILSALGPRLGIESDQPSLFASVEISGPGDTGKSRKPYYVTEDKIGVVSVVGPLVKRASGDFLSGGPTTYSEIETEFMDAITDPEIKGVLLAVDSPGGETIGAFELSDLIFSQRGAKPIIAAADGDAFSAAFLLGSAADKLYVTKSGGIGSVGIWMMHVDQSAYNKQKGIKPTVIFAGARKMDGNPHEPLSDEARDVFQTEVDRLYGMFVGAVSQNRNMSEKAVRATEASLYFGQDGVDIGFADQVGTLNDALAGLRAVISRPTKRSSVVASAASPMLKKEVSRMEPEEEVLADAETTKPPEEAAPPPEEAAPPSADAGAEALAYAADVAELCALAGMSKQAAGFIRAHKALAEVRAELLKARADQDAATEIQSHVPTGANAASDWKAETVKPGDSPIEKAADREAERFAQARKKEKAL